ETVKFGSCREVREVIRPTPSAWDVRVPLHTRARRGEASWWVEIATPMPRLRVSPGGLYTLLNAELKRRRLVECGCRMPLPFHIDRPDPESANWRIGTPTPCAKRCDVLIAEVV